MLRVIKRPSWGCPSHHCVTASPPWWLSLKSVSRVNASSGSCLNLIGFCLVGQLSYSAINTANLFATEWINCSVYAGFIDFIVVPTFTVLTDMTEKIVTPLIDEATHSSLAGFRRSRSGEEPLILLVLLTVQQLIKRIHLSVRKLMMRFHSVLLAKHESMQIFPFLS